MPSVKGKFQFAKKVVDSFLGNHCSMHAAGLTYYSMLALVPVLCIVLLAAKALGADDFAKNKIHEKVEAMIVSVEKGPEEVPIPGVAALPQDPAVAEQKRQAAQAFAEQARGVESQIMERIDAMDFGAMGWVGLALLVWTVISSVGVVEMSFNEIWKVEKPRSFLRRIATDFFVAAALPVLALLSASVPLLKIAKDVIVATVGSTWLTRWVSDGAVWLLDSALFRIAVSLAFSSLAFAFLYKTLPCGRVRWRTSWASGLFAAVAFGTWMKICAVAQVGIAKSSALYGSFAFLPIVLAWMYVSWQIVLLGCCVNRVAHETAPQAARHC